MYPANSTNLVSSEKKIPCGWLCGRAFIKATVVVAAALIFAALVASFAIGYARIAELLRSQYLLWYPSDSSKPTEQFREIRVVVDNKGHEVRTIRGYYPGK